MRLSFNYRTKCMLVNTNIELQRIVYHVYQQVSFVFFFNGIFHFPFHVDRIHGYT